VIDIPDYTMEEKKIIFSDFALPKILNRMSLRSDECIITPEAVEAIVLKYQSSTGIRDLEQVAEHIAAHTLYQIEANHVKQVVFDKEMVLRLLR
jgi:ATP-dependent Lon protease